MEQLRGGTALYQTSCGFQGAVFSSLANCSACIWKAVSCTLGFPGGANGKESTCQCRKHKRCRFDPWVGRIPWRRAWQSTPVSPPGKSHGQRSLVSSSPQGHKELDTTEATEHTHMHHVISKIYAENILYKVCN